MESSPLSLTDLQARNYRVELDKAWETSRTRMVAIMIMTYIVAVIFLKLIDVDRPWINAGMPVIGYTLSTLSLPILKRWWIQRYAPEQNP